MIRVFHLVTNNNLRVNVANNKRGVDFLLQTIIFGYRSIVTNNCVKPIVYS